ncbi:MAG: aldo/keto reductase family protein [Spirochaetales bacterium]|jgi:voltage-dependent potassium channel beta subunit|nr:aldo/keto reductase family protein [Spirochaetales bacterium]
MKYRRLGESGLKVSQVSLGGWTTFGDSIQDQDLTKNIIKKAYELGINFFDIADIYARGKSEEMMGKVLGDFSRHTLVISSKVFFQMSDDVNDRGLSRKHIIESIEKSLKRIGTDYLDIYYCHRYDPETPTEEVVRAMDDLIHQGKILYWGTSEWTGAQISTAAGIARSGNLYAPRVEQPGYSMLRRRKMETDVIPAVREHGIGLTTFSPLGNGVLTGKYDDGVPEDSRANRDKNLKNKLEGGLAEKVKKLKPIADGLGINRAQLAIAWILRHPEVSSVITGATKPAHLESNVKAAEAELDQSALDAIDELFPVEG